MKKQSIDHLFKRLDGELDTEVPSKNHKANFLAKLEAQKAPQALVNYNQHLLKKNLQTYLPRCRKHKNFLQKQ